MSGFLEALLRGLTYRERTPSARRRSQRPMPKLDQILVAGLLTTAGISAAHYGLFGWMLEVQSAPIEAPSAPVQRMLSPAPTQIDLPPELRPVAEWDGYTLTGMAQFEMSGVVLSRMDYGDDRLSDLSPTDLVLAWGQMSAPVLASNLRVRQDDRFYYWSYPDGMDVADRLVETSTANMHMIPADETVAASLAAIKRGDVVSIKGYLVNAAAPDGWSWDSSMTRLDTGPGACEMILISEIIVTEPKA
jgi:hypothetical protein